MKKLYMIFLITCGVVFGGYLGNTVIGAEGLSWLGYSKHFEFQPGTFVLFDVLTLNFGITFTISVAQCFMIIAAIVVYTKTKPKLFP